MNFISFHFQGRFIPGLVRKVACNFRSAVTAFAQPREMCFTPKDAERRGVSLRSAARWNACSHSLQAAWDACAAELRAAVRAARSRRVCVVSIAVTVLYVCRERCSERYYYLLITYTTATGTSGLAWCGRVRR